MADSKIEKDVDRPLLAMLRQLGEMDRWTKMNVRKLQPLRRSINAPRLGWDALCDAIVGVECCSPRQMPAKYY